MSGEDGEDFVFAGEFGWHRTRGYGEDFVFAGEFGWRRTRGYVA
jgi:hypothetical protein